MKSHSARRFWGAMVCFWSASLAAQTANLPPSNATLLMPYTLPSPPATFSQSYVLMNFESGQILAERNPDQPFEPASLTKLMTAYLAFEALTRHHISLNTEMTVTAEAFQKKGSSMFLELGQRVTFSQLLRGLIIQSGNDAATLIAQTLAGSEAQFVERMNERARDLGMKTTQFQNASGLPQASHFASAKDLALLSRALLRDFPQFYPWFSQQSFEFNAIEQKNRNRLLWEDTSVDGLKTGHTQASGYSIATSAEREGVRMIAVIMGAKTEHARAESAQRLLNYGFRFFETRRLFSALSTIDTLAMPQGDIQRVPVGLATEFTLTFPSGQFSQLKTYLILHNPIIMPLKKGQIVGQLEIRLGEKTLATRPLISLVDVKEINWVSRTWTTIYDTLDSLWQH